ncbi:MAG TPA: TldD/PmbA family protein [Thermodesulfobacteriota bacterium]|jgi:PmbA protein|nr:TldD/PmbA family protein [Thermodesulfobacteriota bacterium]
MNEVIVQAISILRRKPIDGYEIYLDQSSYFDVESREGRIDTFQVSHSWGMAFRILKRQRIGFSYTTFSGVSQVQSQNPLGEFEQVIDDAIASSEDTASDPCYDFAAPLEEAPPSLPIFDETLEGTSEKVKIEKAKELEKAARSVDPERIQKVRKASYQEAIAHRTLINSNGLHFSYPSTFCSLSVTAVAEEAGEAEVGWDFDASHFGSDLDVKSVGKEASRRALESLGGRKIPSGVYPVLIHHSVASEFLSLLAHSFKSDQIQKGKSPLKGKKGERCFSPLITIEDNGLHPKGIFTAPIDGEGTRSQRTPLVVQGELSGYLYDRYWANRERASSGPTARSTGNSRRSGIKLPPGIGTSNFLIEPGTLAFSALLSDLHQGVLLEEVMGLHTVDPISGDFSLGCSGKWVDKGKVVHPVKSVAVAGNLFQLFQDVVGIGEDFRFMGGIGSPSLLVRRLKISGI